MYGIGEVKTSLSNTDHTQMNCGIGLYDKNKVYYMNDVDGKVIVDGKRCTVLSKEGYENTAVLTLGNKKYKVVKMPDGKYWLAQNLDWLPDGILFVTSGNQQYNIAAACYYNYTNTGKGLLYNQYAVSIIKPLLQDGWRIALKSDFEGLFTAIGGNTANNLKKIRSTTGWPSVQGTDNYGLNIFPTGHRNSSGFVLPQYAYMFTGTTSGTSFIRVKFDESAAADFATYSTAVFYAIRLVKD